MRFVPLFVLAFLLSSSFLFPSAAALSDPNPANAEWIEGTITIEQPSMTVLDFSGTLIIRKDNIQGTQFRTSDDIAGAYQQLLKADEQAKARGQPGGSAAAFLKDIEDNVTKAFAKNLQLAFPHATVTSRPTTILADSLAAPSGDPYSPGIAATVGARVVRPVSDLGLPPDVTEDQVRAAFEVGAIVSSTLTFTSQAGENIQYVVKPPQEPAGLQFLSATGNGASVRDGDLVMQQDLSAVTSPRSTPITFRLALAERPSYAAQKATLDVTVDLKDVDITFGKAIGGDMGNLIGEVAVVGKLNVIEIPADVKAQLGDKVQLDYLSSDALRLLKTRGLLDDAKLESLQSSIRDQLKQKLEGALGTSVAVTATLNAASLDAPVATPLSSTKPILIDAHATFTKPLSGGGGAGAAIALYSQTQSFDLPRVQGLDTSYTVIFPKGLALTNLEVSGGSSSTGTSADGRDQFTVAPQSDSAHATATMAVTPTFVFAHFLPIVLLVLLLLALIIATPIAVVVLRRRRRKA